jgi:hypothetical protein
MSSFDEMTPVLKVISQDCILRYGISRISLHYLLKHPSNEYYCTVYSTLYGITEPQSHQIRTMHE